MDSNMSSSTLMEIVFSPSSPVSSPTLYSPSSETPDAVPIDAHSAEKDFVAVDELSDTFSDLSLREETFYRLTHSGHGRWRSGMSLATTPGSFHLPIRHTTRSDIPLGTYIRGSSASSEPSYFLYSPPRSPASSLDTVLSDQSDSPAQSQTEGERCLVERGIQVDPYSPDVFLAEPPSDSSVTMMILGRFALQQGRKLERRSVSMLISALGIVEKQASLYSSPPQSSQCTCVDDHLSVPDLDKDADILSQPLLASSAFHVLICSAFGRPKRDRWQWTDVPLKI